jgi:hypothetical protein
LAERHGIVSIPSFFVYKAGKIAGKQVGALPKAQLEGLFKDLL